jgi:hypothetical protein
MSDYLLVMLEDEREHAAQTPKAIAELIVRRAEFGEELRRAGQLRDSGRFRPSREGKRVRGARVDDGPFAGALAAYYWIDVPTLEDAATIAARIPALPSDRVDVRPLMKGGVRPDKEAKPGKIFGFAVLGDATSEAGWVEVMDRIDAETQDAFPAAAALGGNRLRPPSRAMFDGPYLESKEVIGGVFFLRMTTIAEAVRWALQTRFVVYGALEIRELWRS